MSYSILDIARGVVPGFKTVRVTGRNKAVGAAADIWSDGGTFSAYPTTALPMTIYSNSANDTANGTGARTVEFVGLDANWAEIRETVAMAGFSSGTSTQSFIRLNEVRVLTAGSNLTNVAQLFVEPDGGFAYVEVGAGKSDNSMYAVPAGKTALIVGIFGSLNRGAYATFDREADISLLARPFGGAFVTLSSFGMSAQKGIEMDLSRAPIVISEKSDIKLRATVVSTATDLTCGYEMILIDNKFISDALR